jgi:hypothetical protein
MGARQPPNSVMTPHFIGWGQSGAVSTQAIVSGDGYADFTADSLDCGMYGLTHDNPDLNYALRGSTSPFPSKLSCSGF